MLQLFLGKASRATSDTSVSGPVQRQQESSGPKTEVLALRAWVLRHFVRRDARRLSTRPTIQRLVCAILPDPTTQAIGEPLRSTEQPSEPMIGPQYLDGVRVRSTASS